MLSILDKSLKIKHVFYFFFFVFAIVVTTALIEFKLKAGDVIIAFSTLASPLIALQIQTYIEKTKTEKSKKMEVFKTLMATRATPLNFKHVETINMVSVEFYGDNDVIDAWKKYMDVRKPIYSQDGTFSSINAFSSPLIDSLVNLLQKMSISLGLHFYDDEIRNGCYRPQGHVELEENQMKYVKNLSNAFESGKLHVAIDVPQIENKEQKKE